MLICYGKCEGCPHAQPHMQAPNCTIPCINSNICQPFKLIREGVKGQSPLADKKNIEEVKEKDAKNKRSNRRRNTRKVR